MIKTLLFTSVCLLNTASAFAFVIVRGEEPCEKHALESKCELKSCKNAIALAKQDCVNQGTRVEEMQRTWSTIYHEPYYEEGKFKSRKIGQCDIRYDCVPTP